VTAAPPLDGIRVLDTASLYAGPLVATLLADHGAEVVKVEPLAGDPYRSWPAMWALVGRGKRSLALDLSSTDGRALLLDLLAGFDVVVENLPRRVAEERELTPEVLRMRKPSLVVVSASGFGPSGPYAGRPANGTIGEAFAGLTNLTGDADGTPFLPSVPLGDAIAAAFGAMGALAGIVRQLRSGEGASVDLTVFEPILHTLGPALPAFRPGTPPPARDGGAMGVVLRGTFRTSDGGWVAISSSTPRHEQAVAEVVGGDAGVPLRDRARDWMASHPRDEVVRVLVAARVPLAPVNDLAGVVADPHIAARGSLTDVDGLLVAAPVPRVDGTVVAPMTPALGDANDDLLRGALGLSADDLDALRRRAVVA
jgi:crotonobetainyl-CoA:carnitine CoA-transferase CaiB-like acyl-CoA transferase